ncbi:isochorismatase family protein [Bosea minatitlanensis]|uniref:Isochorismatase family protein n=1 Tax=Bosea minatitlanensis TaxID=128782 RepID=A0ABW0F6L3_9HYPH|nr:isochorismatase family protein [Bosea minatitlanensis]MCT4494313.1 isochorismatase family protein [Bosea minatitlanensis]
MPLLNLPNSLLLVVDLQARLMPAIHDGARVVANAARLLEAGRLLAVPVVVTEQNPGKLGPTVPELAGLPPAIAKMSFDACAEPAVLAALGGDRDIVLCGCEAHVCVGQTALTLLECGRRVVVVQDAVGSRAPESRAVAIRRLAAHGAEIVTTEMVLFEWLRTAAHPQFRAVSKLIR